MSRSHHDALTRLFPGAQGYAARRAIRRLLARLVALLPPGVRVRVSSSGWEVEP